MTCIMNFKLTLLILFLNVFFLYVCPAQQYGNGDPNKLTENEQIEVKEETPQKVQQTMGATAMDTTKKTITSLKNMMRKKPTQQPVEKNQELTEDEPINEGGKELTEDKQNVEDAAKTEDQIEFEKILNTLRKGDNIDLAEETGNETTAGDKEVNVEEVKENIPENERKTTDEDLKEIEADQQFLQDNPYVADETDIEPTPGDKEVNVGEVIEEIKPEENPKTTDEDLKEIEAHQQFLRDNPSGAEQEDIETTPGDKKVNVEEVIEEIKLEEEPKTTDEDLNKIEADKQFIGDNAYFPEEEGIDPTPGGEEVDDEEQERQNNDEVPKDKVNGETSNIEQQIDADNEEGKVENVSKGAEELDTGNLEINDNEPEDEREEVDVESGKNEDEDPSGAKEDVVDGDETNNKNNNDENDEDHKERVFCVVMGNADPQMRFSRDFPSDICHTVVYGKTIVIEQTHVIKKLAKNEADKIKVYAENKHNLLFIVIMKHTSYSNWSLALSGNGLDKEVEVVVQFAKKHKVAGIQFANLYPQVGESVDSEMACKLIVFFKKLNEKIEDFGIGVEINALEPSVATSFPYEEMNKHVDWYALNTIDSVKCSPGYLTGTNPLTGSYSIQNSVFQLLESSIEMAKVVIGLQMFATTPDGKRVSYGRMCKKSEDQTKKWCAESSEALYLKGYAMRFLDILGVQLYYVDMDDFMGFCGCDYYPAFRALHAGLRNLTLDSVWCSKLGHSEAGQPTCTLTTGEDAVSVDQDDSN